MEKRGLPRKHAQLRVLGNESGGKTLVGYFAVFDRLSRDLGGFVERVDARAFDVTLSTSGADVISTVSHQIDKPLGRVSAGNLRVGVDKIGARYEVDLLDTQHARDLTIEVEAGIVLGSSFMFDVVKRSDGSRGVEWSTTEQGYPLRTLTELRLYEVGPTALPAYPDTEQAGALALRSLADERGLDPDEVFHAARHGRLGAILTGEERSDVAEPTGAPASSRIPMLRRHVAARIAELPVRSTTSREAHEARPTTGLSLGVPR